MAATRVPESVEAFLASLNHPLKPEILALRQIILAAHPSITEGIKWNVPSFRTTEYFATMHLRRKTSIGVILHFGAKKRDVSGVRIDDPQSLLEWLAADRALVSFQSMEELTARETAFTRILRQWIRFV